MDIKYTGLPTETIKIFFARQDTLRIVIFKTDRQYAYLIEKVYFPDGEEIAVWGNSPFWCHGDTSKKYDNLNDLMKEIKPRLESEPYKEDTNYVGT